MQTFQKVLFDVQSELKKSVELMRRNASMEKSGMATFKLRHDVPVYEAASHQFTGLQVNAQEIEKGLNALATNIPKAADGCGPTLIPPLFSQADEPGAKVAPRAPTGGGTTLAREPVRADVRRLWWRP